MDDHPIDEGDAIRSMLLYAFLPAWFVPGVLDWYHHRKTKIETTSGPRESLIHAAMFAVVGVPVTLALFFEVDPPILTLAAVAALAHEGLTMYDVAYATDRRVTAPAEQHVHSFLEAMPILGTAMLFAAFPTAARSLVREPAKIFSRPLRRKSRPVPANYLWAFFGAIGALIVVPYAEEMARCYASNPTFKALPADPGLRAATEPQPEA